MVSILPSERTPFDVLGRDVGNALQQVLPGAVQQGYERGQIQQGLSKVSQQHPELKTLLDSIAPFAGTRQGAQYVETVLPEVLKQIQQQQQVNPQTGKSLSGIDEMLRGMQQPQQRVNLPEFGEQQAAPTFQPPSQPTTKQPASFAEMQDKIKKGLGEQYFPYPIKAENVPFGETRRPQKAPKPPKPIGPVEEQRIRAQLREDGITRKELQDDYINKFKQLQNDEYKAASQGYKDLQEYQKARQEEDDRFFKEVIPSVKETFPGMGADEENIWKGIARTNEDIGGDEARLRDTNQRYQQLVEGPLSAFSETGPELPYFSIAKPEAVNDALEDARTTVQGHLNEIKKIETNDQFPPELKSEITNFLRKKYRTLMAEKDFGVSQGAYAVSNLSDKSKNAMNSIPKYPTPKTHPESPLVVPDVVRNQLTNDLSKVLLKLDPEDSLLLMRDYAIQNNYPDEVFNRALNMALKNGLILSPFQMQERPELSIPQRMDLQSVLRGKRSVWDLTKGKK